MKPDERRAHLEGAAITVLRREGRGATTKGIATEAGVAEGTIFRVFETKEELIQAALARACDPSPLLDQIAEIDAHSPLRAKILAVVTAYQRHLVDLFELMNAVGIMRPPESVRHRATKSHTRVHEPVHVQMLALIEPHAHQLTVTPTHLVRVLRLLTFSGSNAHIAHGHLLTPEQIVHIVLDGAVRPGSAEDQDTFGAADSKDSTRC